jgi:hypothetical protein
MSRIRDKRAVNCTSVVGDLLNFRRIARPDYQFMAKCVRIDNIKQKPQCDLILSSFFVVGCNCV